MIRKTFLALGLSAALALNPATIRPAAAQENNDQLAKILLGAIAAGIVLNTLRNRRDRDPQRGSEPAPGDWPHDWYDRPAEPQPDWRGARVLPQHCLFEIRTRRGWRDVFGRRCLERAGIRVNRLPSDCVFEIDTNRGRRSVYGARCLDNFGYRTADSRIRRGGGDSDYDD